ncbi:MAG TPA: cyclopropane fatty acyl phospholipid synthase, partial [Candidatus Obscuribacterales bacterium]
DGPEPHDPQIHDERAYQRMLLEGTLGLGETYMDGWWDCEQPDAFVCKVLQAMHADDAIKLKSNFSLASIPMFVANLSRNLQTHSRAKIVNAFHYDLDNDLFQRMLDPRMVYTCAYWEQAQTLAAAQEAKLDLVCRKLKLEPGMRVLDIGCGFGSFVKYAAEKYGVRCVGYTLSQNQFQLGRELCAGLPITLVLDDYRNICGEYDRVVSIGMFEAVGARNFRTFMQVIDRVMKPRGIALLHTMVANTTPLGNDPWFEKYIFPNGLMPSLAQIAKALEGLLIVEDIHNIGPHYDPTLMAWNRNFQAAWPELAGRYSPAFKRMWEFYLLSFAGAARARYFQLFQMILTRVGQPQPGYREA